MVKVAVLGACGGIGQPLSLLIKTNEAVTHLSLYDVANPAGVAADLSHINTPAVVTSYQGADQLDVALGGADIVVIPAGVPRKPGMTRDDLFNINAGIVQTLVTAVAKVAPKAFVAVISNPVNSTVPIAAEVLKKYGVYDPKRLFGVTTLDVVRASRFVSEVIGRGPSDVRVSVIGGHSGVTIVPLLSQLAGIALSDEQVRALTQRIQYGGDEVVKAKDGAGSATLSMAFAGARFVNSLVSAAFQGGKAVVECAYVESSVASGSGVSFFATPVELGASGVEKIQGYGKLSAYEEELLAAALPELQKNIAKGVAFAKANL